MAQSKVETVIKSEENDDAAGLSPTDRHDPITKPKSKRLQTDLGIAGFILGLLTGWGMIELGFGGFQQIAAPYFPPLLGLIGAIIIRTRAKTLLWVLSGITAALFTVVSYTPLSAVLIDPLLVPPHIEKAPALVVLASDIHRNGDLNSAAQSRFLRAYELLQRGYAPEMVVTRQPPISRSYIPTVKRQMRQLSFDYPVEEAGIVANTHDEAVLIAALAKRRGWNKVLLVTQPWHMRRAMAVFAKAGLRALPAPCVETEYELTYLRHPGDRRNAFRNWLHETMGIQIYRMRGWIN
jgi:uncharacterized SAM-binding protein YcdF (DUF218 family)